ncbi:hypothetical protein MESS2_1000040 [Mesorhizobium metallidurans STM 2683]|uniref:Ubiquitin-like protease family profile domain-containing protein n=1 Tax=Mesorhizobium metallidurans STM 2683 TaxID=1297569 RepID=M5ETL2_9HYPH|nr:hypothetical protein MESS2_1000040 [Mesorhizobium metallidurans STM 2683]
MASAWGAQLRITLAALPAHSGNEARATYSPTQQDNGVDCGVFVVDGTRELVQRSADEQRPETQQPLHLNDLVADRQKL